MLEIRKVLIPTDYSEAARRAFDHARFVAARYGASLHILHVTETNAPEVSGEISRSEHIPVSNSDGGDPSSLVQTPVYAGDQSPVETGRPISIRRFAPSAAEGILEYAREVDADLIVMGTHGRSGARRLLMGSVAEEVVRRSMCPVLTVRAGSLSVPGRGVSRILVPVDFSDVSRSQVQHAQELASTYAATLDLLHVIELPNPAAFYRRDQFHSEVPSMATNVRQSLIELAGNGGPEVPTRFHVLVGHPASDILSFAEAQASDLIVIATHASKGGRHMLIGGVAEQVIRRAPLLVVTINAAAKSLVRPDRNEEDYRSRRRTAKPAMSELAV